MFKKENRLPAGIKLIKPDRFESTHCLLKISKAAGPTKRFAFLVSKAVDKRAVVRNSIKRKLRSCIEQNIDNLKPGDYLFIIKKEVKGKNFDEICKNTQDLLKRAEALK